MLCLKQPTRCGCKTKCETSRCRCLRTVLFFTDLCSCNDCDNENSLGAEFIDDISDDESI